MTPPRWIYVFLAGAALALLGAMLSAALEKGPRAMARRLSAYLMILGLRIAFVSPFAGAFQYLWQFRAVFWVAISLLSVGFLVFLLGVFLRMSGVGRRSPLSVSNQKDFFIVEIKRPTSNFEGIRQEHIECTHGTQEDLADVLPKLSTNASPAGRTHIICLDGTWNDPRVETNVHRLFKLLDNSAKGQIARYYTGVGITENVGLAAKVLGEATRHGVLAAVTGKGERLIRHRAYLDFVVAYRPDDRVVIFGFSRGAASSRILANEIFEWGVPERMQALFQRSGIVGAKVETLGLPESRLYPHILRDIAILGSEKLDVDIAMMGLWDTVGAFGLPLNKVEPFRKLTIPENVKKVCHLVAIDERRFTYDATLINRDPRVEKICEEIWFAGAHTNVGGGFIDKARRAQTGLSDITLRFMIERANQCGIKFKPEAFEIKGDVSGPIRESLKLKLRKIRVAGADGQDSDRLPLIHKSVFNRQALGIQYAPPNVKILDGRYSIADESWPG